MQRRDLLVGAGFSAAVFLTPALRWLTVRLDERPAGDGERLVGAPDVETVRQITNVYRTLDNQYGGAHVRDGLVRFLTPRTLLVNSDLCSQGDFEAGQVAGVGAVEG